VKNKQYKYLDKLGIKIYNEFYPYIKPEDLEKALTKEQLNLFNTYFGSQTCLARKDGGIGVYPYDAESVLVRIFEKGRLTGTQKYFD
jgi:hypothetical protein